eukprot:1181308-Prorocentrum_minimum.AAC.3
MKKKKITQPLRTPAGVCTPNENTEGARGGGGGGLLERGVPAGLVEHHGTEGRPHVTEPEGGDARLVVDGGEQLRVAGGRAEGGAQQHEQHVRQRGLLPLLRCQQRRPRP